MSLSGSKWLYHYHDDDHPKNKSSKNHYTKISLEP